MNATPGDLVVLVADLDAENVIVSLLNRPADLRIRPIRFKVDRHPNRDNGCCRNAVEFLRRERSKWHHCIVLFDLHGSGRDTEGRDVIENNLTTRLSSSGWRNQAAVVVIAPELETWVWSDAPAVTTRLGWNGDFAALTTWLRERRLWEADCQKPSDPKEACHRVVRAHKSRKKLLASDFKAIARDVPFENCQDPAFVKLKQTLRAWFPV